MAPASYVMARAEATAIHHPRHSEVSVDAVASTRLTHSECSLSWREDLRGRMTTEKRNEAGLGVMLVTASTVAYSTAGYFTRLIELDPWTILFWRGLYAGLTILAFIGWQRRGQTLDAFAEFRWPHMAVALCSALATIALINALRLTSVADVLVISATAPFMTAAIAWVWIGERTRAVTLIASAAALCGVIITISGARASGVITGDLLAIIMAFFLSVMMVIIRKHRDISMLPATCLSAFLCSALVLPFAAPSSAQGASMILLMLFGATQFGLGLLLLTLGTPLISATRTALIRTIDVPLSRLWVWLAVGEVPPAAACTGGAIIMVAVVSDNLAKRARSN